MKRFLLLCFCISCVGCSYVSTEFVDQDGTHFKNTLYLAPFSTLARNASKMGYQFQTNPDQSGTGKITVGGETNNLDNSAQLQAITVALEALKLATAGAVTGGVVP